MAVTLRDALKKFVKDILFKENQFYSLKATVDSYDASKKTCNVTPINEDPQIFGVNTMSQDGTGVDVIPKVGSVVTVTFYSKDRGFISQFGEIDGVNINGDSFSLVKSETLEAELKKNNLILEQIQLAFTSWTPVTQDGGAVLKGLSQSFVNLQTGDFSNIANEKIKHGSS